MSRFGNTTTGVVFSVADEKDGRYTTGFKRLGDDEVFPPERAPRRTRQQHDDPTPSGSIRRPHTEETPTGQIRRQQAQDPFRNG